MVIFQEDQTKAQTTCAPKTLKCPTVALFLYIGTMLQSCLTMLVLEEDYNYKKKKKPLKTTDVRHKVEDQAAQGYLYLN